KRNRPPRSRRSRRHRSSRRSAPLHCRASTATRRSGRCSAIRDRPTSSAATFARASTTSRGFPILLNPPARNQLEEGLTMATYASNDDSAIVVIGSGAGGGTLANELCQKGLPVVLLEAGDRQSPTTFRNEEWFAFNQLAWLDKRTTSGTWRVAKD